MNENIRLLRPLFRGLPIVILAVIIAILSAKKYLTYVTPMYESTAKLRLADVHEGVPGANLFKDLDVFASANKIATEIEVLKSSQLIEKTINELPFNTEIYRKGDVRTTELFENSPITIDGTFQSDKAKDIRYDVTILNLNSFIIIDPQQKKKIKGLFGKPINFKDGKIIIALNDTFLQNKKNAKIIDHYEFEFLSQQKLLSKINGDLDIVSVDKDVPVIRINYKSNVPEKAALFVNKLAEMYINDYIQNKFGAANTTVNFLKKEIQSASGKLATSESNIQNFKDEKKIINISQETETDLRKISQLKIQQTNLKMNLDAIKELNTYIASGKDNYLDLAANFEAFTDLLSTEMVKKMKQLQSDKKDLLLTYTPENEKVKIVDAKIKDLTDYQIESIKNTEKNLQVKYDELSSNINAAQKVFIGLPEKEKMLNILNREFNLYENNYNFLNTKRIEADIAKSAKMAFHKIIAPGEVSKTPVSPIRGIILVVAAFMALLGSILLIYIVHFAKAKVNDAYTIEKKSTIPIAFITPFIKEKKTILANFLKEALQIELKGMTKQQSLLVISSYDNASEHKFHTENLINAFQAQGRKILIIDAVGNLEGLFDADDYVNYSNPTYLSKTKTIFETEIQTKIESYDLAIVNNQTIADEKLALLFMSMAHHNLFVLDSRKTAEKKIVKIELLKDEYQLPNFWFVLNKANYNPSIFYELKKLWNTYIVKQKVS